MRVTGVSGEPLQRLLFFQPLGCQIGETYLKHSFFDYA